MKNIFKNALLVTLLALPLFSCNSNPKDKTYELKPTNAQVLDKHQAVSTLGKAIKSSTSKANLSAFIESSKDLKIHNREEIHNSIENADSIKDMSVVANGITIDYRVSADPKLKMSIESNANQVHWENESPSGKVVRNRVGVKLSSYIKDETFYIDPTNKEFSGLVYDIADYLGYGDYRTLLMGILSQKYYLNKADLESTLKSFGIELGDLGIEDKYNDFISTENIDKMIVNLDSKVENWEWLTSYSDNGDSIIYASMNKTEFCALMEELDPPEEGEERQSYEETLKNVEFTSLEFRLTFNESTLKSLDTVFAFTSEEKDVPVTEKVTVPVPGTDGVQSDKQIGTKVVKSEVNGGFKVTFGEEITKDPAEKGWSNLMTIINGYLPQ